MEQQGDQLELTDDEKKVTDDDDVKLKREDGGADNKDRLNDLLQNLLATPHVTYCISTLSALRVIIEVCVMRSTVFRKK